MQPVQPIFTAHLFPETLDALLALLTIMEDAGGQWQLVRDAERWQLMTGSAPRSAAEVVIDQETAWRLLTKGVESTRTPTGTTISIKGEQRLGQQVYYAVSIIA